MKRFYINLLTVLALAFSGVALADDHADKDKGAKGKEKAAQMKNKGDDMDGREEAEEEMEDEGDDEAGDEAEDDAAKDASEQEDEEAGDRKKGDMPRGLEKKDGAPQAGKGSEKGQQMREEKSQSWWKFWD